MNTAFFSELLTNKIRKKKGQAVFTCHARSTLEAAVAEIINEIRSCDLSKWTGNRSLLIGRAGTAPGRWPAVFLPERTEQAGSCRCQGEHCHACQGGLSKQKLVIQKKKCALYSCNCVSVFIDIVWIYFVFHIFVRFGEREYLGGKCQIFEVRN